MAGQVARAAGIAAAVTALAGCYAAPAPSSAEVCATRTDPPRRLADRDCDRPRSDVSWYYVHVPGGGSIDVPREGAPLAGQGAWSRPTTGQILRAPAAGGPVRGGLGSSSAGTSSGG